MIDTEKCAHDIAIVLLQKSLGETKSKIYLFDEKGNGSLNACEIVSAYHELYHSILEELTD